MKDDEQEESRNRLRAYEAELDRIPEPVEIEVDERPEISHLMNGFYRTGTFNQKGAYATRRPSSALRKKR